MQAPISKIPAPDSLDQPYQLSEEQIQSYNKNGFLILKDLFDEKAKEAIVSWSHDVQNWPEVRGSSWMPYRERKADGQTGLCRVENYADSHSGFSKMFRGKRLLSVLDQINGQSMILYKEKINFKSSMAGGFDAHCDAPAYASGGAEKHLTINVAVDQATMENGCLEVVPGSHLMKVDLGSDNCIPKEWENSHEWIPVPLQPGDSLVFGSFLAHRSGPNLSPKPRAAIYATFNAQTDGDLHASYYADRRLKWPPTFEREEGKDYSEGALQYGFGSPMSGATEHSRLQKDLFQTLGASLPATSKVQ